MRRARSERGSSFCTYPAGARRVVLELASHEPRPPRRRAGRRRVRWEAGGGAGRCAELPTTATGGDVIGTRSTDQLQRLPLSRRSLRLSLLSAPRMRHGPREQEPRGQPRRAAAPGRRRGAAGQGAEDREDPLGACAVLQEQGRPADEAAGPDGQVPPQQRRLAAVQGPVRRHDWHIGDVHERGEAHRIARRHRATVRARAPGAEWLRRCR